MLRRRKNNFLGAAWSHARRRQAGFSLGTSHTTSSVLLNKDRLAAGKRFIRVLDATLIRVSLRWLGSTRKILRDDNFCLSFGRSISLVD